MLLAFLAAELLGRVETDEATEAEARLLRLVTPLAKLTTGKQAVAVASEALECFGGAGYVEDTGLPMLLRDAQVLPIWEGTTNVLSLDILRTAASEGALDGAHGARPRAAGRGTPPRPEHRCSRYAVARWTKPAPGFPQPRADPTHAEAGARRLALTLGRTLELALLVDHAQWALDAHREGRAVAAANRLAAHGVDLISDVRLDGVAADA